MADGDDNKSEFEKLRAQLKDLRLQLWSVEARSQNRQRELSQEREQGEGQRREVHELNVSLDVSNQELRDARTRGATLAARVETLEEELEAIESHPVWRVVQRIRRLVFARDLGSRQQRELTPKPPLEDVSSLAQAGQREDREFQLRGKTSYLPLFFPFFEKPTVSVIIPVFNQVEYTYSCLEFLRDSVRDIEYEVIIVDDASDDATRDVDQFAKAVRVLRASENAGFLTSCNWGAREAKGEYLVFLNNDTQPKPGWLRILLETFRDHPEVGAIGPKLVYPDDTLQESGGIVFNDGSGWNYGSGNDPRAPEYNFLREVDYCSGACLMVPRALFFELGMFDSRFIPAYYEDTDLCFSVRAAGKRVLVQPLAEVVHFEGKSCGTELDRGVKRYQVIHRQYFQQKWQHELEEHWPPPPNAHAQGWMVARASERRSGPRVLVVDARTPMPDNDSGSLRMFRLLQILSGLSGHVTFAAITLEYLGHYTSALQHLGVEVLYRPYVESLEEHLEKLLEPYDAVVLSRFAVAAELVESVRRRCPDAKLILDTVDLHFLREEREEEVVGKPSATYAVAESRKAELALARACDLTLVVSREEREILSREAPKVSVELLSNVHTTRPTPRPFADRSGMVFVGGFEHTPNRDAIEYYAREIEPRLQERLPGVVLTIIGRSVTGALLQLESETLRMIGQVPDIFPYFDAARISIAPLRFGAGVKGKINSSMSYGVPVVTTSMGAEGVGGSDGAEFLVADDPGAFVDAIARLYTDEALWSLVRDRGLRNIEEEFSFEVAEAQLRKILALPDDRRRMSSLDGELVERALALRPAEIDFGLDPGHSDDAVDPAPGKSEARGLQAAQSGRGVRTLTETGSRSAANRIRR